MGMLDGKVVFITGGSRGQGRAHAVASAREGADIVMIDVTEETPSHPKTDYGLATAADMAATVTEIETLGRDILAVPADVRSQSDMDEAVARGIAAFGKIDVMIANAGIVTYAPFWEIAEDSWNEMIDVNLSGVWRSAKAVAPHMIERQMGSVVLISSVNGVEAGATYAHYTAAKHGVLGLMRTMALELAPHGVRCNAILPGAIFTRMTEHQEAYDRFAGHPGGTREDLIPAGRRYSALKGTSFLSPEDIANAALFLNSSLASSMTGICLPVDGGHMTMPGVNRAAL
jgi:SDR family mycofactocin-dependent oxidoreductase